MTIERYKPAPLARARQWGAAQLAKIRFPAWGGQASSTGTSSRTASFLGGTLPGSDINWNAKVKDPATNAAVWVCLRWLMENITEPEAVVEEQTLKGWVRVQYHELPAILEQPNNGYDGDALRAATSAAYAVGGESYWLTDRDKGGRVRSIWWAPPGTVSPVWPQDGSEFVSGYVYRPGGGAGDAIPYVTADVVHFQFGLDGYTGGRHGVHRTAPVYREIAALNEGSTYTFAILSEMGMPSYLFTPKDKDVDVNGSVEAFRQWYQHKFTRDGRGKPLIPSLPLDAVKLGMSPEELCLSEILVRPELRVCGAFGIHPMAVYLGQGAKQAAFDNGGQHAEARKASYQDCIVPMLKRFGKTITNSFLANPYASRSLRLRYDFGNVEAMSEDRNTKHERARLDYQAGGTTLNEFRSEIGMPPVSGGDTRYINSNSQGATQ